jgi:hypothetical protein
VKDGDTTVLIHIRGRKDKGETRKGLRGAGKKEIIYNFVSAGLFHLFLSLSLYKKILILSPL